MQIKSLHSTPLIGRSALLLEIKNEKGISAFGEIAPLPLRSKESLEDCLKALTQKKETILALRWHKKNWLSQIRQLSLFPSVSFALESAIGDLIAPQSFAVEVSAFLSGSYEEILRLGSFWQKEGYTSAKLKVSQLSLKEAEKLIHHFKEIFYLRVDVNRAWEKKESLAFFSQFRLDDFDYVEEPFKNPKELREFTHPLAVDESFPNDLSISDLCQIPQLKALIYKPTTQGGMAHCLPLYRWARNRGIDLVLSSSLESPLGLGHIAALSYRLGLSSPVGIGTFLKH